MCPAPDPGLWWLLSKLSCLTGNMRLWERGVRYLRLPNHPHPWNPQAHIPIWAQPITTTSPQEKRLFFGEAHKITDMWIHLLIHWAQSSHVTTRLRTNASNKSWISSQKYHVSKCWEAGFEKGLQQRMRTRKIQTRQKHHCSCCLLFYWLQADTLEAEKNRGTTEVLMLEFRHFAWKV